MKHQHDFESVYHPTPTAEMQSLGVRAAEIRRCRTCQKEIPFVLTTQGWVQLFEETEQDERDILLA